MADKIKYPRTYHLPWSLGATADDKTLKDTSQFDGHEVVITEKLDGENTSLYTDGLHARSLDSRNHPSRNWIKNDWATKSWELPESDRIVGENMFAVHSIKYNNLESYFYGLSYWQGDKCLDWDSTVKAINAFGYPVPMEIWRGKWNEKTARWLAGTLVRHQDVCEGYVVRITDSFQYDDFKSSVAKYVREDHVQSDQHWAQGDFKKNIVITQ